MAKETHLGFKAPFLVVSKAFLRLSNLGHPFTIVLEHDTQPTRVSLPCSSSKVAS